MITARVGRAIGTPLDLPIVCFHGSPGLPDEFKPFAKYLQPHLSPTASVIAISRRGYPSSGGPSQDAPGLPADAPRILLGYSWGAVESLREAVNSRSVRAVILVAPYAYPKKSLGLLKKALIQTPALGDWLLQSAGKKIIDELFEKSCHPRAVPSEFWNLAGRMAAPEVLRRAALEKEAREPTPDDCLRRLSAAKVPVFLVWGTEDRSSSEAEQIAPLKSACPFAGEARIEGAGHAIPWTHARELAEFVASLPL